MIQPVPISRRLATLPFVALIYLYKVTLAPFMGGQCRFVPTCSTYALDAYREFGVFRGTSLTISRIARCHPFSKGGYDPVPVNERPAPLHTDRRASDRQVSSPTDG